MTKDKLLSRDGSVHVTDERINTLTSLVGSVISVILSFIIIEKVISYEPTWYQIAAIAVYITGLINLFVMSTLHHGLHGGPRVEKVFRTLDYTAIFWLIGGTISALVAYEFANSYGLAVLTATWLLVATGIALRASISHLSKDITNTLFISLGWFPALALLFKMSTMPLTDVLLLASGGLIYSVGFMIYILEKPNPIKGVFGFHEIWHILVILAATLHALLVLHVIS